MKDEISKKAFKEVYEILKNVDQELLLKIPNKFLELIENNMDNNYNYEAEYNIPLDKQKMLPQTKYVLSLIYRIYFTTEEEKKNIASKDKIEFEKLKKLASTRHNEIKNIKDIDEIFSRKEEIQKQNKNRKTWNKKDVESLDIVVYKEEKGIKKVFTKIFNIFKRKNKEY